MGLGTVEESRGGIYLSIAGGFIWNRKSDKTDENFATQSYNRADGTEGTRSGAQYADLIGMVVGVQFRTHSEYGESINVTFVSDEEKFIISISTNNRYSQDMMKALLNADLSKELFLKPYDFIGKDNKRAMGISFRQDGEKISLKYENTMTKDKDWFKEASKKDIRRFFEDLTEWYVAEVEEKVCSQFSDESTGDVKETKSGLGKVTEKVSKPVDEVSNEAPIATPLKMKRALKAYIADNYEGKELPKLSKSDLVKWYQLSLEMEDLPFETDDTNSAEVSKDDLENQLDSLIES